MTSVVLVPRGGCASSKQCCAHCRAPIPAHRHRRARYCRDSCRITAAKARRAGARAIPAPSPQPTARPRPRFTEDLAWAKDKPEILKAKPAVFAAAAWNLIMPCGGKPWIDQDKPEVEPAQKKKARG
jgi:hypothetical protein